MSVEKSFDYFRENHDALFRSYPDKYLVIAYSRVLMAAATLDEAVDYTIANKMTPGSFIIQQCTKGDSAYTQTFHSRAVFA